MTRWYYKHINWYYSIREHCSTPFFFGYEYSQLRAWCPRSLTNLHRRICCHCCSELSGVWLYPQTVTYTYFINIIIQGFFAAIGYFIRRSWVRLNFNKTSFCLHPVHFMRRLNFRSSKSSCDSCIEFGVIDDRKYRVTFINHSNHSSQSTPDQITNNSQLETPSRTWRPNAQFRRTWGFSNPNRRSLSLCVSSNVAKPLPVVLRPVRPSEEATEGFREVQAKA